MLHKPEVDTIIEVGNAKFSYGPRIERTYTAENGQQSGSVETPNENELPHFWGVYKWQPRTETWSWVADVLTERLACITARALANALAEEEELLTDEQRDDLIDKLVDYQLQSSTPSIDHIFRDGWTGYRNKSDAELLADYEDAFDEAYPIGDDE